ncbi:MAG: PAS domain-containing protein [Chloroflexota bacterium]
MSTTVQATETQIPETMSEDVQNLRRQLESTQAAFVSVLMEKNFLTRAMADLNFHHNAHDGIVFTDVQGRVVYANPYFLKMMNIEDPAELLGKPLPSYMWNSEEDAQQLFKDVRENGFVRERELNLYNRDKAPIFVACSSVASKDAEDNFVGTEIMLCNITSKRKFQTQLSERTQVLERVTEFTRSSLDYLKDMVQRRADYSEMQAIIAKMQDELSRTV